MLPNSFRVIRPLESTFEVITVTGGEAAFKRCIGAIICPSFVKNYETSLPTRATQHIASEPIPGYRLRVHLMERLLLPSDFHEVIGAVMRLQSVGPLPTLANIPQTGRDRCLRQTKVAAEFI